MNYNKFQVRLQSRQKQQIVSRKKYKYSFNTHLINKDFLLYKDNFNSLYGKQTPVSHRILKGGKIRKKHNHYDQKIKLPVFQFTNVQQNIIPFFKPKTATLKPNLPFNLNYYLLKKREMTMTHGTDLEIQKINSLFQEKNRLKKKGNTCDLNCRIKEMFRQKKQQILHGVSKTIYVDNMNKQNSPKINHNY